MARWWWAAALGLAMGCAPTVTIVDTSGVAIDPEGRVWFVKRYRLPERPDALYLVRCTRDDPPKCKEHRIEGQEWKATLPDRNTSGSSAIPM